MLVVYSIATKPFYLIFGGRYFRQRIWKCSGGHINSIVNPLFCYMQYLVFHDVDQALAALFCNRLFHVHYCIYVVIVCLCFSGAVSAATCRCGPPLVSLASSPASIKPATSSHSGYAVDTTPPRSHHVCQGIYHKQTQYTNSQVGWWNKNLGSEGRLCIMTQMDLGPCSKLFV